MLVGADSGAGAAGSACADARAVEKSIRKSTAEDKIRRYAEITGLSIVSITKTLTDNDTTARAESSVRQRGRPNLRQTNFARRRPRDRSATAFRRRSASARGGIGRRG